MKLIILTNFIALIFVNPITAQFLIRLVDVSKDIGKSVVVCSKASVPDSLNTGMNSPTYLIMGETLPDRPLTILVPAEIKKKFSYKLEDSLMTKMICVTGTIEDFGGKLQI